MMMTSPADAHSGLYTHAEEPPEPPSSGTSSSLRTNLPQYQTTQDGDVAVLVMDPPAPGDARATDGSFPTNLTSNDHSGPLTAKRRGRRSRNLSDLFLNAATLSEEPQEPSQQDPANASSSGAARRVPNVPSDGSLLFQQLTDELNHPSEEDRKHRRLFSDESLTGFHPPVAHRRLDSVGTVERKVRTNNGRVAHQETAAAERNGLVPPPRKGLDSLSKAVSTNQGPAGVPTAGPGTGPSQTPQASLGNTATGMTTTTTTSARPSLGLVSTGSYEQAPHPRAKGSGMVNYTGYGPPPPTLLYPAAAATTQSGGSYHYPVAMMAPSSSGAYPTQRLMHPQTVDPSLYASHYDYIRQAAANDTANSNYSHQPPMYWDQASSHPQPHYTFHKGSQTFVTNLAVGDGTKEIEPTKSSAPASYAAVVANRVNRAAHHRKLSSFSTALNNVLDPTDVEDEDGNYDSMRGGHHRKTSSSMSFLNFGTSGGGGFMDGADDAFLRNLQASNAELQEAYRESQEKWTQQNQESQQYAKNDSASAAENTSKERLSPSPPTTASSASQEVPSGRDAFVRVVPGMSYAAVAANAPLSRPQQYCTLIVQSDNAIGVDPNQEDSDELTDGETSHPSGFGGIGSRLAAGGTSKRVRRKCTVGNCENRVVQGGLCIAHGAKRKQCKHPGCDKNVKKAGLCSAHGPARKRCVVTGCEKVAVQGGRCIGHGARKKLCVVSDCSKQAIINGMCKRHHDLQQTGPLSTASGDPKNPGHQRGLSIFQEMSADAVSSLLNEESAHYYS